MIIRQRLAVLVGLPGHAFVMGGFDSGRGPRALDGELRVQEAATSPFQREIPKPSEA